MILPFSQKVVAAEPPHRHEQEAHGKLNLFIQ
jgi:hypothetical protein